MKHFSYIVNDIDTLKEILKSPEICLNAKHNSAVLVQIYCATINSESIISFNANILNIIPNAIIIGASTIGEIVNGLSVTSQTIIGFSFFRDATLYATLISGSQGHEDKIGMSINNYLNKTTETIKAVLLLSTSISLNIKNLFKSINIDHQQCILFGGGAGDYSLSYQSNVFMGEDIYDSACIIVAFTGPSLQVEIRNYLGWLPLSKAMTITSSEGTVINTIDNKPAFDIYKNYLGINNDDDFFINSLEFPLLLERNQKIIARVPVNITADEGLQFVADIKTGETFKLGYGDPKLIIDKAKTVQEELRKLDPEAIFLYSCGCRRFLMQNESNLETLPFQDIAPTFGFYTYGEYAGPSSQIELLNSAMVVAAFKEGDTNTNTNYDPYANNHTRVVSRLVKFIAKVTTELEQTNLEIKKLSALETTKQHESRNELINFISMLGHEIKTPLAIIDSIVQSLALETLPEQTETINRHQNIRQAIKRLDNLLNTILVNKRFNPHSEVQLIIETWQVYDLVDAILSRYNLNLPDDIDSGNCLMSISIDNLNSKIIKINCSNYDEIGQGDFSLLQVALNNLIENAYKYSPPQTEITFDIETIDKSTLRFNVSNITDNFSILDKQKIFNKYYRGSEKNNVAGAGLGLYLTRNIAQQHRGSIDIEFKKNVISFILDIPLTAF